MRLSFAASFAFLALLPMSLVGADTAPKKKAPGKIEWKEQTIEFSGVKVSALLPSDAELDKGETYISYSVLLRASNVSISLSINTNDEKNPYPLEDPDGKFIRKRIDGNGERLGIIFEHVKTVKVSGFAGVETLTLPQTLKGGIELGEGAAGRSFHLKRTEVNAEVHFLGKTAPEEMIRKLFDSMKIEFVGPLRGDPTKIVKDSKGIPTTIENKVTFRMPGKAVKYMESGGTHWAYPKRESTFDVMVLPGYFDDSLTHEGLLDYLKRKQRLPEKAVLLKKADCGKQLGIIFSTGKPDDILSQGRVAVIDPGAIVFMRVFPKDKRLATEENAKVFLNSLEIDPSAPAIEVWKTDMDRRFKIFTVKEANLSVCLPREPKTMKEKGKTIVYFSNSADQPVEKSLLLLTIEPAGKTTLAKKFAEIKTEIGDKLWKDFEPKLKTPKGAPPILPSFDLRHLDMTYMAGRHGILWDGPDRSRHYFTIIGDKQVHMIAQSGVEWESFFRFTKLNVENPKLPPIPK